MAQIVVMGISTEDKTTLFLDLIEYLHIVVVYTRRTGRQLHIMLIK